MTKIKPLGCRVAVAKSPDNVERRAEEGPQVAELGGGLAVLLGLGERERPGSENGAIVKGIVTSDGDCEHHHFEEGQVIWYLEDAAIQLGDTYVVSTGYVLAKEVDEEATS